MPKIVTPNTLPALKANDGAHHYRLIGLEFAPAAGVNQTYNLIAFGDNQPTLAQLPHDLILDRVYIHGRAGVNLRRGVMLNSASTAVIDSYISECHEIGADSQAIGGWNGPGPFKIVNFTVRNQDGAAPWSVVQDITFTNNIVRHSSNGVNLHGSDDNYPSPVPRFGSATRAKQGEILSLPTT